ncbi:UNVERIFIED_CONTAM: hypothetical protein Sradi_1339800 [Sesamum radiatum]|uniref:Uncharacterized protein n=1 Tax=Sesamum radiatum TaxID=300843 RepID=A0AAW2UR04_SESRA
MTVIGCRQGTGNGEASQIRATSSSPRQESPPQKGATSPLSLDPSDEGRRSLLRGPARQICRRLEAGGLKRRRWPESGGGLKDRW